MDRWYVLHINPDPWAIGPISVGKRNGKYIPIVGRNEQLYSYQEAVKAELADTEQLPFDEFELTFFFWRRLDTHETGRKHQADATNLLKATEDALQGVLFENDRNARDVRSTIVAQGPDMKPCVVIRAREWIGFDNYILPDHVRADVNRIEATPAFNNTWNGPGS